ncbi:Uncharacterised protein [Yersinia enterocolitica]|uniref:hypothetical protein n=1 Tax=Yersinia enterocolitica TaxID=630 RepID=UPI00050274E6|nr:hypothetical protein [Yersinia enterocolitica]AJI84449.1 hypothetical protein CH47_3864 [Yersinia enterocolitica]ELI8283010.1 hypothetical protein [Yersinia enterocolitica]KGA69666.1 hypothetical protein DJ59_2286 [Yersinia enterocolitica]KGA77490.1 hypothetical protein DJ60_2990 [Yersinia enterocolitica]MCE3128899.1 hypothetical protein [Yersinia enterocolitica]
MKIEILKTASARMFAIDLNKANPTALEQRISQRLSSANNRPMCLGRAAGLSLMQDCKQANKQQAQQKQVKFATMLTYVQFFPKGA